MDGIYRDCTVYEDEIIEYCRKKLRPEEVFPEKELIEWALDNGYTKI